MKIITTPNNQGDGITVFGPDGNAAHNPDGNVLKGERVVIEDAMVDFDGLPLDEQDGGIDCVEGANVLIRRCIVRNVGKAVLCGNEHGPATVTFEEDRKSVV